MTNRVFLFVFAICGLLLSACGDEGNTSGSTTTVEKAKTAKPQAVNPGSVTPATTKSPSLNFCHNGEFNPKKPFNFVYFNLTTNKNEMKRIRDTVKAEMAALKDLPPEAKAKTVEPHLGKSQVLAALAILPLADQMQRVSATLCNFNTYAKDKCTGLFSRSVTGAEIVKGALSYSAPVENFSSIDPITETRWTENPDCSGQFRQRRKNTSIDATWTSPKNGVIRIDYNYCRENMCFEGTM